MSNPNHNAMDFNGLELRCDEVTATGSITAPTITASTSLILGSETIEAADLTLLNAITASAAELNILDGVTATAAELNYLDIAALGTGAVSKAVVLSSTGTYTGPTSAASKFTWSVTSNSTDAGTSVEPFVHNTTMTGPGGVGGRARFELDTNVALGAWANALKAQTEFGATGSVTGLGSSLVAEMSLSAGTAAGTYAPIEVELNLATGALTGTATSLIYASVNGDDAGTFDTNGHILNLAGLTAGASNAFRTGLTAATVNAATTAALRILVGGTAYYIPLATATA